MLALTQTQGILLAAAGGIIIIAVVIILSLRGRKPGGEALPDIPAAMKPGPSDPDLEKPHLEKLQGWGIVLVAFMAIWIPLYWLQEPTLNKEQVELLRTSSIERGHRITQPFGEENSAGVGCVRCHGPELRGQEMLAGANVVVSANLTTVCSRQDVAQITTSLKEGVGEVMPSWGVEYGGAMNDQQISDLISYIITIQDETEVPFEKNKCINEKAASPAPVVPATDGASPAAGDASPAVGASPSEAALTSPAASEAP